MTRTLVAALALSALAACGGGGDDAPRLSRAEYVSQANAICKDVVDKGNAVEEPKTKADYVAVTKTLLGLIEGAQRDLKALRPPEADEAEIQREFLAPNDRQADVLRKLVPDLEAAKTTTEAEQEFGKAFTEFGAIAESQAGFFERYGLEECA